MQRPESRPASIVAWAMSVFLITLATLLTAQPAAAAPMTYTVTNPNCEGAGSITEAMNLANANPDVDTITFTSGLVVDFRSCPPDDPTLIDDYFTLRATESVVFEGNGARLEGVQSWISASGVNIAQFRCADPNIGDLILASTPGFILVGTRDQDNSGITVTVRDLDIAGLSQVALIEKNATLVMEDLSVARIFAGPQADCKEPAIRASDGANFAAHRTVWGVMRNSAYPTFGVAYQGVISGFRAGDLTVEDSLFDKIDAAGVIAWDGQAGSTANIVTSRFDDTGGIAIEGDAAGKIVNSIWASQPLGDPELDERIVNLSSQPLDITASTVLFASDRCDPECQDEAGGGLPQPRGWVHRGLGAGDINFAQSAVAVNFPNYPLGPYAPLLDPNHIDPVPGFSADLYTWMMQTQLQDTAALQAVTDQASLLTDPPDSLPTQKAYLEQRATPLEGGELIEAVDDAVCDDSNPANDGKNALRNPIDGSCITTDALGNPRVDGSGRREIGAVQLGLAPHLSVRNFENQTVLLGWTKPLDPGGTITGYQLEYRQTGSATWTPICVDGADTLEYLVTALTNGTEYEFRVDGLTGGCPSGTPSGNPSNIVRATPVATVGAPTVAATPSVCQTHLSWTEPDAGVETIDHYTVVYRLASFPNWTLATGFTTDLEFNVTGLIAGETYEFGVRAITTYGTNGSQGTVQATTTKGGDIDLSGTVTYNTDRPLFLAAYGSSSSDGNYNPDADLDCDGRVTPADYRLWYKAWVADGREL